MEFKIKTEFVAGEAEIECPECGRKHKVKLETLSPGKSCICPGCGLKMTFEGDDVKALIEKELAKIFRSL